MGKGKSLAKQRLDKYYTLAKEKGYRARSAFKLIQIDNKYNLLSDAEILIDLCAAPGGWLQVASQRMPPRRKIIGIDLDPIKYIGDAETLVSDITSLECREALDRILGVNKADIVLHDGAPNVGTSWENDAFNQNMLVLHALKLASEFLKEGGHFITKIFRSVDYFSLLDLCNKLFENVEATKPMSSRMQSAEIFVVCKNFRSNAVDQTLFELDSVFGDKEVENYEYTRRKLKFTDFIKSEDPGILKKYAEIEVDLDENASKIIGEDILALFKDLRQISKIDVMDINRLKKKIIRSIQNGKLEIESLNDLKVEEEMVFEEFVPMNADEKLAMINKKLNSVKAKPTVELPKNDFFEDRIFENFDSTDCASDVGAGVTKVIEVSSCSDSLSLDEEEKMCAIKLKENPDEFIEDTIDRYIRDPEEKLPNYLREMDNSRPCKRNEDKYTKKEIEAIYRRKNRAERRAEKFMKNVVLEDSDELEAIGKKIYKSAFKKTKAKPRLAFPNRGSASLAKGKGRIKFMDRRMKKDGKSKKQ